jgi:osmoprotectant transport system ATP-binding protein
MNDTTPHLSLDNVTLAYDEKVIIRELTLHIPRGQRLALVGSSGSGKSTVLKCLAGLLWPRSGRVSMAGLVYQKSFLQPIAHRIGLVIQDGGLFPHLTARDNVTLVARFLKWPTKNVDERLAVLTELARLDSALLARYPLQLSGGQRQRIALMRALMLEPEVMLLDEPLGALDPLVRFELQQDLKHIFESLKTTLLLVTHDVAEAQFLTERVVLLSEGSVVQDGTIAEMRRAPKVPFVTRFLNAQRTIDA